MAVDAFVKVTSPLGLIERRNRWNWNATAEINLGLGKQEPLYYGFTEQELMDACLDFYSNGTAKLKIEFVDTHITQIERDLRDEHEVTQIIPVPNIIKCVQIC
jgi:hypothetical protein